MSFEYLSRVSDEEFKSASTALDTALLRAIGLPEDVDIRGFENAIYKIINKVNSLIRDFTLSTAIWVIPDVIEDAEELYKTMKPTIKDKVSRTDFISRVIVYAYRKHDPDLPVLVEPFESMVENIILNSVPTLVEKADSGLEPIIESWIEKLVKFFK